MAQLDVKDLRNEKLPASKFPVDPRANFRLHIAPEVRTGIQQHAKADKTIEICGVLVGNWHADENGPYASITDYIRCDNASSKFAEVTFTHESWAQINKEMDSKFANLRIVGWYHSHPDFGIFLSERDCFIHEHFFAGPGQVAYVFDPVRGLEGMFAWQNGKPTPLPHFWVGNTIRTVEASERNVTAEIAALRSSTNANAPAQAGLTMAPNSSLGFATTAMGVLLLFLLGYLYGGWRSQWERQMIVEGVVADFANAKVLRVGLDDHLEQVRQRLKRVHDQLAKMPQAPVELPKEKADEAKKQLDAINDDLAVCNVKLDDIARMYCYNEEERKALSWLIQQKEAELRRLADAATKGKTEEPSAKTQSTSAQPSATQPSAAQPKTDKAGAPGEAAKNTEVPASAADKKIPPSAPAEPKK